MRWVSLLVALVSCRDPSPQPPEPPAAQQAPRTDLNQAAEQQDDDDDDTDTDEHSERDPGVRARVKILVMGDFDEELELAIARGVEEELQVEVERLPRQILPPEAYYHPRRRYRADKLLDHLRPLLAGQPAHVKVIGFVSVDISTTAHGVHDWGVFGLGDVGGRASVISTFRLSPTAQSAEHLRFRVVTTAIHEVGHTLGLDHCTESRCVMNDAHGSIDPVDNSTGHLGPECRAELDELAPRRRRFRSSRVRRIQRRNRAR